MELDLMDKDPRPDGEPATANRMTKAPGRVTVGRAAVDKNRTVEVADAEVDEAGALTAPRMVAEEEEDFVVVVDLARLRLE